MEMATVQSGKSNPTSISWLCDLAKSINYAVLASDSTVSTNDTAGKDLYAGIPV